MKIALAIVALVILFAVLLPLLHLLVAVLVVAGGVIVVMAAWKVLFRPDAALRERGGGPPALR